MTERKAADEKRLKQLEDELGLSHEVAVARLDRELGNTKVRLDPDLLTPRDLRRAREVLEGRNPFELLEDPIDRVVLIAWCLLSRDDPAFTWQQADDTPFSAFEAAGDEGPPPTGPPSNNGTRPDRKNAAAASRSRSSAASTG